MILHHITLATGHTATHRIDTFDAGAVAACRTLLPAGGSVPGFPAFRVRASLHHLERSGTSGDLWSRDWLGDFERCLAPQS